MIKKVILPLVIFYTIFGFFIAPYIIKSQLVKTIKESLRASLSIGEISLNPYTFNFVIKKASLVDERSNHLVSFDELNLNIDILKLINKTIYLKNISLLNPNISLELDKNDTLNLSNILKTSTSSNQNQKSANSDIGFVVDNLKIIDAKLSYKEQKRDFDISTQNLNIKLDKIDTKSSNVANLRLSATLSDLSSLDIKAKILRLEPFTSELNILIDKAKLYSVYRYLKDDLNFEVASGEISLDATCKFDSSDINSTSIDAKYISLDALRLKPRGDFKDFLRLQNITLNDIDTTPLMQKLSVKTLKLDALDTRLTKNSDSSIKEASYFKNQEGNQESNQVDNKKWDISIPNIELSKISMIFEDKSIQPTVTTNLNELNINIDNFSPDKPFLYALNLRANDTLMCDSNGQIAQSALSIDANLECNSLDVVKFNPYIENLLKQNFQKSNIAIANAKIGFNINTHIKEADGTFNTVIDNSSFKINDLSLLKKDTKEPFLTLKELSSDGIKFDNNKADISSLTLESLKLDIKKDKNNIDLATLIEPKKVSKKESSSKGIDLLLKDLNIKNSNISIFDNSIKKAQKHTLNNINLNIKNINTKPQNSSDVKLNLSINNQAKLTSDAKLKISPLELKAKLSIDNLSLKEANAYLDEFSYLSIKNGLLSLNSYIDYEDSKLDANGDFTLKALFVEDSRNSQTVLSISQADFMSFNFKEFEKTLNINKITLDHMFSDIMIDKNKKLNLSSLIKPNDNNQTTNDNKPLIYNISRVNIKNGSGFFADYSIPIHFKTLIHSLNGGISAITNKDNETTHIKLNGVVDDYGEAKIEGSLNPSNVKSYLDIALSFKNLELNAMSGYIAEFAGYKIDDGKLYLELKYKIQDSKLASSNDLKIKNILLGSEIEDENITKLPLSLAIMLLEDNNGLIDISLPIEGDVDSPDFKYGKLIFKAIANLVVKAVASPFKFLAKAIGVENGDELEDIKFELASDKILPYEKEKLDKIALALEQKDALNLEIQGGYDSQADLVALQEKQLKKKVFTNTKEGSNITSMLEDIYKANFKDKSLKEIKEALSKKVTPQRVNVEYQKELFKLCSSLENVSQDDIIELSNLRAKAIFEYLTQVKKLPDHRIKIRNTLEQKATDEMVPTKFHISL